MARNRKASFDSAAMANSLLDASSENSAQQHDPGTLGIGSSSKSVDSRISGSSVQQLGGTSALDHLDALGREDDAIKSTAGTSTTIPKQNDDVDLSFKTDDHSESGGTLASSNQRLLLEALMGVTHSSGSAGGSLNKRDRFESWGGMSDLSAAGIGDAAGSTGHAAAALAASALHHTGLIDDVTNAAAAIDLPIVNLGSPVSHSCNASAAGSSVSDHKVPTKISLTSERKYSVASLSDASAPSNATENTKEVAPDIHAFVAAAMATVGEQLKELNEASCAEESVASEKSEASQKLGSATASIDTGTRPRSLSTCLSIGSASKPIAVDFDAVEAAVNAAQAATGAIDLETIASMTPPPPTTPASTAAVASTAPSTIVPVKRKARKPKPLPLAAKSSSTTSTKFPPIPKSTMSPRDMEEIRARARQAAGYVPPSADGTINNNNKRPLSSAHKPLKKRAKRLSPPQQPDKSIMSINGGGGENLSKTRLAPPQETSEPKGQSNQKWNDMYDCLLEFVEHRRQVENKGKTEEEKKAWVWDGNVPTTYKTKDGKNLGRWINNQRHAKSKDALKDDREERLVATGLKWSVLSVNAWSDMLGELKKYIKQQTKDGKKWDGNVPTNYRIKRNNNTAAAAANDDEDKNLGRWINRQRSLFQAGKLKRERQLELEKVGLKWSVLATTSWQTMFDSLVQYANERKEVDPKGKWDGNVPANYKTQDVPPKSLGRWVNRQRSAYAKQKLKKEFVDKLNEIGLRWAVHERRSYDTMAEGEGSTSSQGTPAMVSEGDAKKEAPANSNGDKENGIPKGTGETGKVNSKEEEPTSKAENDKAKSATDKPDRESDQGTVHAEDSKEQKDSGNVKGEEGQSGNLDQKIVAV